MRINKKPPKANEVFGSDEDKLDIINVAAATVPRLAASSGLEAVVNDSQPCRNNLLGAVG